METSHRGEQLRGNHTMELLPLTYKSRAYQSPTGKVAMAPWYPNPKKATNIEKERGLKSKNAKETKEQKEKNDADHKQQIEGLSIVGVSKKK